MADHLWVPGSVRAFIRDLVDTDLRRAIHLAIMSLADDPVPPDAREFRVGDEIIKDAYELDVDLITIFYRVDGEHVSIHAIAWRVI